MRILVLTPSFLPRLGGLEMAVHHLSFNWARMGHEVVVANMSSNRPSHPDANYDVRRIIPLRGGDRFGWHRFPWNRWMQHQLRGMIKELEPDIISAHFAYPCAIWLGNLSPSVPWSVTCHARDVQVLEGYDYGYRARFDMDEKLAGSLRKAARVIVLTKHIQKIVEALGVPSSSVSIIPNGADPRLRDWKSPVRIRSLIHIPDEASYIVSVGRNYFAKGFDKSLAAFSRISSSFPNTYYLFVGKGTDALMHTADSHGVTDRVRTAEDLAGADLCAAYQQATVYVSASRIEGFSLTGVEALMAGLPILATECPGNSELVLRNVNGFLCPVDDVDEMARLLARLLSDPALRRGFSQASRELSYQYEWRNIAARYLDALSVRGGTLG